MEEAEALCDRVAIMDTGRIVALGTPAQLIRQYASEQTITANFASPVYRNIPANELANLPAVTRTVPTANGYILHTTNLAEAMNGLLHTAEQYGAAVAEISTHSPTLEDVFINLTGKMLRD